MSQYLLYTYNIHLTTTLHSGPNISVREASLPDPPGILKTYKPQDTQLEWLWEKEAPQAVTFIQGSHHSTVKLGPQLG